MSLIEGFEAVLRIVWDRLVFRGTTNDAYTPRHGQENSTRSAASHGSRAGSRSTHKHTPHSAPARFRSTAHLRRGAQALRPAAQPPQGLAVHRAARARRAEQPKCVRCRRASQRSVSSRRGDATRSKPRSISGRCGHVPRNATARRSSPERSSTGTLCSLAAVHAAQTSSRARKTSYRHRSSCTPFLLVICGTDAVIRQLGGRLGVAWQQPPISASTPGCRLKPRLVTGGSGLPTYAEPVWRRPGASVSSVGAKRTRRARGEPARADRNHIYHGSLRILVFWIRGAHRVKQTSTKLPRF